MHVTAQCKALPNNLLKTCFCVWYQAEYGGRGRQVLIIVGHTLWHRQQAKQGLTIVCHISSNHECQVGSNSKIGHKVQSWFATTEVNTDVRLAAATSIIHDHKYHHLIIMYDHQVITSDDGTSSFDVPSSLAHQKNRQTPSQQAQQHITYTYFVMSKDEHEH